MTRVVEIDPVTRIEGHAKVHLELGDSGSVEAAFLHILEFRGFERFVQGVQVELMPTLTTRVCGTCPHAQHLVAAKTVDRVFSAPPPRAGVMLRELLNCGSMIHSHGIHFFVLAGPDLFLGIDAPPAKRSLVGLLEAAPELAGKVLRLRSIGQKICEIVGGRGTHPVTAVGGGMAAPLNAHARETLKRLAAEGLELAKLAVAAGKQALDRDPKLLSALPLAVANLGTVRDGGALDLYDGALRLRRADGTDALEFEAQDYAKHLYEEALPYSYGKQTLFRDGATPIPYRVGPLARVNAADRIDTPLAAAELAELKARFGAPTPLTVVGHYARLVELLHCAEKAVLLLDDDEIASPHVRTKPSGTPRNAIAHVEAPRGVLIHDYGVDANGVVQTANFIVATQHNISSINSSIRQAAELFHDQPDEVLLNGVEFAIRCYDPCLSCSTHAVGAMPIEVAITRQGRLVRTASRGAGGVGGEAGRR